MSVLDFSNMFKGNSGKETDLNALLFDDEEPTHTLTSDVPTDVSQHSMDWIYRELELLNIVTPGSDGAEGRMTAEVLKIMALLLKERLHWKSQSRQLTEAFNSNSNKMDLLLREKEMSKNQIQALNQVLFSLTN